MVMSRPEPVDGRHFAASKKAYEQFVMLGEDEYYDVVTEQIIDERIRNYPSDTYVIRARSDKVLSWRVSHLAFQAIYIYSDVVASQVVGDVRTICCASSHRKEVIKR